MDDAVAAVAAAAGVVAVACSNPQFQFSFSSVVDSVMLSVVSVQPMYLQIFSSTMHRCTTSSVLSTIGTCSEPPATPPLVVPSLESPD